MSLEMVKAEIARFLAQSEPGVLGLRGRWGVGKTYAWNEQLNAALKAGGVSQKVYAYVSLFGINSLDQLKFAIFEQSQKLGKVLKATGFDTLNELIDSLPNPRRAVKAVTSGSLISKFISGDAAQTFAFALAACRTWVCG